MRFPRFVPLYVVLTLSTLHLLAQSPDGNMNGLVSDPSSAAVVGAEVVAVNDVTGVQYTTKTNTEGIYVLPNLPSGPYRLQVSKIGFKTIIKPDIILNVQDALSINFTLPIGAAYEVLTVEGGAPLVNTESAAVSTVVDQTYVKNMPLNGRSFQDLLLLTPGVVTQTPQPAISGSSTLGQNGEFSVNGQRTESNYYTVDGVSANVGATGGLSMALFAGASGSLGASTALGTTQALVSVDDLQEFRVQSSSYSAEYGRNPGGQLSFETKSGTSHPHGTAFDYLRNNYFDASDWFDNYFGVRPSALRQNDFGGTMGGPLDIPHLYTGKDKTFFFFSYEGLRLISPQAANTSYVPDAALRSSAPAALRQVLNAWPMQSANGIDDTANGIAQFIGTWSNPGSIDSTSIRFDHTVSERLRLFFRFSNTSSDSASRSTAIISPSVTTTTPYTLRTYTFGGTSTLASHVSNEFRLNYSSNETSDRLALDALGGSSPLNLSALAGLGSGAETDIAIAYGGYALFLGQQDNRAAQRQWNLIDTVSFSLGRHRLKLGVDYRRLAPIGAQSSPAVAYYYLSEDSIVTNSALLNPKTYARAYPLYENLSAFAQDSWRVSPRLNLSLGLRWEVNPAPSVTQGLMPYTLQGTGPNTWALAPEGTRLWRTTWFNLAPRFGAAYVLHDQTGRQTVVRAGGGVFFDTGQQLGSQGFLGTGFSAQGNFQPISFPGNPVALLPAIVNPPVAPYSPSPIGFTPHLQLPYTLHWNAAVEQALGGSEALSVSYVGSHAARLLEIQTFEAVPTNPIAAEFEFVSNGLASDYDSLQVQFQRRFARGLTALASYTWSHCLDYGSENYNFGYQRGGCDFDVRHNLSLAFSYDFPNLGHKGFAKNILHHWGLDDRFSARTAFPVTLLGNPIIDPATSDTYYAGLDLVPEQPIYLYGTNCAGVLQGLGDLKAGQTCPGGRAINPQAFADVTSGFGNAPRNFARGFGAEQMDLALRRQFPIHENLTLQFRVEAFNVFNHPNFGMINSTFGQTTFGQATATLANSLGVLSPLYQMGGPRSMQFSLRVAF
jgi:hypothetical protein